MRHGGDEETREVRRYFSQADLLRYRLRNDHFRGMPAKIDFRR